MRTTGEAVGAIVIIVGVVALLGTVGGDVSLGQSLGWLWPLLIVGFGLWLILAASQRGRRPDASPTAAPPGTWQWPSPPGGGSPIGPTGWGAVPPSPTGGRHEQRLLGEIEMAGPMQAGPLRAETLIGEIRLDLTAATFPAGETRIQVSTLIGEVRVLLPADVAAAVHVSALVGECEALGRTGGPFLGEAHVETEGFATASTRIRLHAQALIGEVAVRRARVSASQASPDTPGAGFAPVSSSADREPPTA